MMSFQRRSRETYYLQEPLLSGLLLPLFKTWYDPTSSLSGRGL